MTRIYDQITQSKDQFFLIAGPCVVESKTLCRRIAQELKDITGELQIPLVFKASFKKANRSSLGSFSGLGDFKALEILAGIREEFQIPVLTDIHEAAEAEMAAAYVDILQIPAFLCRQTELLLAAGRTGKPVNVKKGQFLGPDQMQLVIDKIASTQNRQIFLTERGSFFGYQDLVVDFRSIPIMKKTGYPVVFDGTHSLQKPNSPLGISGGRPEFIPTLCSAAIASGVDGLFLETHPTPDKALSDGDNMLKLSQMKKLLQRLSKIYASVKES